MIGMDNSTIPVDTFTPAIITIVLDCNQNGVPDATDISSGASQDCDGNSIPDDCQPDCNANGVADVCDIAAGTSVDCDANGVPDECEPDCNGNGIADGCDLISGSSGDCNGNGVPDECESAGSGDCNGNGVADFCDLSAGTSLDCNANGVPDECDIALGTSGDCNANGRPDDCETDCNSNAFADECDLAAGRSMDANGDGVPDECGRGFALVPVGASVMHRINGQQIIIPPGGVARIMFDVRVGGWGRGRPLPPSLKGYQATLDPGTFASGASGRLTLAMIACSNNDDCFAGSACLAAGVCDPLAAIYIDAAHPNFVFAGEEAIVANRALGNPAVASVLSGIQGVADPGSGRYAGTIMLAVSADATGTFTVGFLPAETFWFTEGDVLIDPLPEMAPAVITVTDDCNENLVPDSQDLAGGTSLDGNQNRIPDECERAVPDVDGAGGRYLAVSPRGGVDPVALYVVSAQFPCVRRFVALAGDGTGRLSDTPTYLPPSSWGTVSLRSGDIVPGTTYQVCAQFGDGSRSWATSAATWRWGDADGDQRIDVLDVAQVVNVVKEVPFSAAMRTGANVYDCGSDGLVNVLDIAGAVDALKGLSYPCAVPCR